MRILVVEDDRRMRALLRRGLEDAGHLVAEADRAETALEIAAATPFEVLVLDVMLPGMDGVTLVRRLRGAGVRAPVLMLTARDASADVVAALDAGADDYVTKPFALAVLLARLRALDRRGPVPQDVRLRCGDLTLDVSSREVGRGDVPIVLTRTEFNLLECLMRRAGRVVTRRAIIEQVWGAGRDIESNTLDAFIRTLRQKIDGDERPPLLRTVRGVGYAMREDGDG
ncbi:MAG: response regulator transcription factor [Vicinamibacterales bacterium]